MRIWHKSLLGVLPQQQLVSQWRELVAIKRKVDKCGTPNHLLVNKVLNYDISHFKKCVMATYSVCKRRGINVSKSLLNEMIFWECDSFSNYNPDSIFKEWHDKHYLIQCYYNLEEKFFCGGISQEEWIKVEIRFLEVLK